VPGWAADRPYDRRSAAPQPIRPEATLTSTEQSPGATITAHLTAELDGADGWRLLLVEDDDGDALIVRELLADGLPRARVERVTTLAQAREAVRGVDCVLLDVGLPDAEGTAGVAQLVADAPDTAVVVLTGAASEVLGVRAVAAGAQDYLVKGRVDDQLLARSVRYAVERQRAGRLTRDLFQAERRRVDNLRMERALTPPPLLRSDDVALAVRYRAGREGASLGGDFYDALETDDGTITVLIGDVAGHGPDAAALGVRLRSAWRALTLSGIDQPRAFGILDTFLRTEAETLTFATLSTLTISPDRARGVLLLAGHPPPLLLGPVADAATVGRAGHLLGVMPAPEWDPVEVPLGPGAAVLMYTDGLIEGRSAPGARERLGIEAVIALTDRFRAAGLGGTPLLDTLLTAAEERNGGPMSDDVALCLVSIPEGSGGR
jgi:serine phosphatase RsbU (regulator of sigma subunit)